MHWLLIGYMWLFIHRPFEVWPLLGDLRVELLYVLAMVVVWAFGSRLLTATLQSNRQVVEESRQARAEMDHLPFPRILQAHKADTPPYAHHVVQLGTTLKSTERLLRRAVPMRLAEGWELFRRREYFDVVVTADYRTSLVFGALCRLFSRRSVHVVKELYLDEAVLGSSWRRRLFRWALRDCDCVVTNSSAEQAAYATFLGLSRDRVRFLPWPSNLDVCRVVGDDGSVFAAGRSWRDWPVLFAAARNVAARFVVVAESGAVAGLERPSNLELHCDVPRSRYLELLRAARVVVVPLVSTVRSTGQATILEAMALAKPVVAADSPGVADYIASGVTGLLYPVGKAQDLAAALTRLLRDEDERRRLAEAGVCSIEQTFNRYRYAARMLELVRGVWAARRPCRE